jgi:hypothetical protein
MVSFDYLSFCKSSRSSNLSNIKKTLKSFNNEIHAKIGKSTNIDNTNVATDKKSTIKYKEKIYSSDKTKTFSYFVKFLI